MLLPGCPPPYLHLSCLGLYMRPSCEYIVSISCLALRVLKDFSHGK